MVILFLIFLRNLHTVTTGAEPIYIPTNGTQVFSLHPHQQFSLVFLIIAILIGVRCYFIIVLICIFLMSDVEQFLTCLLAICVFSLENVYILCPVFNWVVFVLLSCMGTLYVLDINPLSDMIWKYFLPLGRLLFHFVDCFFCCAEAFLVWCSPTCFCFCCLCFLCRMQIITTKTDVMEFTA